MEGLDILNPTQPAQITETLEQRLVRKIESWKTRLLILERSRFTTSTGVGPPSGSAPLGSRYLDTAGRRMWYYAGSAGWITASAGRGVAADDTTITNLPLYDPLSTPTVIQGPSVSLYVQEPGYVAVSASAELQDPSAAGGSTYAYVIFPDGSSSTFGLVSPTWTRSEFGVFGVGAGAAFGLGSPTIMKVAPSSSPLTWSMAFQSTSPHAGDGARRRRLAIVQL